MAKVNKTPVSIRMSADELELLDQAAEQFDGNKTKAMVEGLKALLTPGPKGKMSKTALMAEIDRRLK
jgi:hypothetical protein